MRAMDRGQAEVATTPSTSTSPNQPISWAGLTVDGMGGTGRRRDESNSDVPNGSSGVSDVIETVGGGDAFWKLHERREGLHTRC